MDMVKNLGIVQGSFEIGLIVPTTDNAGTDIDIKKFESNFLDTVGGYTTTDSRGGWVNDNGTIFIDESVTIVTSFSLENIDKAIKGLSINIKELMILGEQQICFLINGNKFFIDNQDCTIKELMKNIKPLIKVK